MPPVHCGLLRELIKHGVRFVVVGIFSSQLLDTNLYRRVEIIPPRLLRKGEVQEDSITPSNGQSRPEAGWKFENSYARLSEAFYIRLDPVAVRQPKLVVFNEALARVLGLDPDALKGSEGDAVFSGNRIPDGGELLAQAYAGHQFGFFTILGDGRLILLGEQVTPKGERIDIQYKGSGKTPFSRQGDGRAALGPMLREYVISEALYTYGRQPPIAQWNLARFAERLLPLIHEDLQEAVSMANEVISEFPGTFRHC